MLILTVEDEFLISDYLRGILERARHYRYQYARFNGRAPISGCHQGEMAAHPLDRRDRVHAAKQERIASRQSFYFEAVWGGRYSLGGAALPVDCYDGGGLCPLPGETSGSPAGATTGFEEICRPVFSSR